MYAKEIGPRFVLGSDLKFSVYADDDYAAASNHRRSMSGVSVMLWNTVIG